MAEHLINFNMLERALERVLQSSFPKGHQQVESSIVSNAIKKVGTPELVEFLAKEFKPELQSPKISSDRFLEIGNRILEDQHANEKLEAILELDADNNSKLGHLRSEFLVGTNYEPARLNDKVLAKLIAGGKDKLDGDKNGRVTLEEIRKGIYSLCPNEQPSINPQDLSGSNGAQKRNTRLE